MSQVRQVNWWDRNWKWFVPVACLGAIVFFIGLVAGAVFFAFGLMKSSDVYKSAFARAQAHPAVVEALGSPVRAGLVTSGTINVSGHSGTAELAIPISGPKGKGTIFVEARKSAGRWSFGILVVEIKPGRRRIDLLTNGRTREKTPPAPGAEITL